MFRPIASLSMATAVFTVATVAATAQAPIERPAYRAAAGSTATASANTHVLNPAQGIQVLTDGQVSTVSSAPGHVELRLDSGRANVSVNHPSDGTTILVDLPGGQADLIHDGFYTFNAATNTLSVLHGEAIAFPLNAPPDAQGKTVREMQGAVLGQHIHPDDLYDQQAQTDILTAPGQEQQPQQGYDQGRYGQQPPSQAYANSYGDAGYGDGGYGYAGYPVAYGGYPYYAGYYGYGYPWGWDYAWGYPVGFGIGFGWGGYYGGYGRGFYGGGYRGGYGYGRGYASGYGGVHPGTSYGGVAHSSASYSSGGHSTGGYSGGGSSSGGHSSSGHR